MLFSENHVAPLNSEIFVNFASVEFTVFTDATPSTLRSLNWVRKTKHYRTKQRNMEEEEVDA